MWSGECQTMNHEGFMALHPLWCRVWSVELQHWRFRTPNSAFRISDASCWGHPFDFHGMFWYREFS